MTVLIYTLGDREQGLGHVKRCVTLARELVQRGVAVVFATQAETPAQAVIEQAGFPLVTHPAGGELDWPAAGEQYGNLIVDIKGDPSEHLMDAARPAFASVVVISAAGYAPQGV